MMDLTQGNAFHFIATFIVLAIAIFLRYLIMAGLFYFLVHIRYPDKLERRKINNKPPRIGQFRKEIIYSFIASLLFSGLGTMIFYSFQKGDTAIYTDINQYHWIWLILSIPFVLIIHETYYYWIHRWMHWPGVYRWIHRTHHESLIPSAWTSFSFHPVESLLQAMPLVILIYLLPLHPVALVLILVTMSITSVINHLNSELYPAGTSTHWIGKWWIGATHHSLHHTQFKYNFGLYFTFWDHWMDTESPDFQKTFEEKTGHK